MTLMLSAMKAKEILCDILVIGAGVSGIAAAAAASGKGAKTVLIEQSSYLGGTVITGMHRYICGLYSDIVTRTINGGIAHSLLSTLRRLSTRNRPIRLGRVYVLRFRRKDLLVALRLIINKNNNLKLLLHRRVCAVIKDKDRIIAVQAQGKGMTITIRPKVVIDASGVGIMIRLSGAKYRIASSSKRQLAGFSIRVKGLKNVQESLSIKVPYYIKFATFTPLDDRDDGLIRLNIPAGTDMPGAREKALQACHYLQKMVPEFKDAYIAEFAPSVVEREGICLDGQYTLTASDLMRGRRFKDGVVNNAWPIELWDQVKGPQFRYLSSSRHYEIPLRCMKSKNIENLLATGRCISATHEALGSTRAAGTCISLGEQAGLAAAKLCASC